MIDGITYLVDGPCEDNGVKATVTAIGHEATDTGTVDRMLHRHRFNLDHALQREKFATIAGTDAGHLNTLRDQILDYITPVAVPADEAPEPATPEIARQAQELLAAPDLLAQLARGIRTGGYAGDLDNPVLLYLALTSRVTKRPINVLVGGPSSGGKNFLVDSVVAFVPGAAVYHVGAMSERALVYTDADFQHRHVVISEAAAIHRDGIGTLIMRCLVWGNQLDYEVTEQDPAGGLRTRRITKPGPTGLITTSVKGIEDELNTRLLTLTVPDDEQTTRAILRSRGDLAAGTTALQSDYRVWHEAQRWIAEKGARQVVIPFAADLAALFPVKLIRARRDFPQLLALIEASAILHQRQRDTDDHERIVATEDDYRIVYELAAPVFGAAASEGVTPAVRETIATVRELTNTPEGGTVSVHQLAATLNLGKPAVSRRVGLALRGGFLVNEEDKKGRPYKLRVGDPLPEEANLPKPERVFDAPTPPETVRTLEHHPENPHDDAETTVRMGDSNTPTVRIEHPHRSNGGFEQLSPHGYAETRPLFECSNGFAGGRGLWRATAAPPSLPKQKSWHP
jgi:hypothetical protein